MKRWMRALIAPLLLLLVQLGLTAALIPSIPALDLPQAWSSLIVLGAASFILFLMNCWCIIRGGFRWHIEGAVSLLVWIVLWGAIVPTLYAARETHTASSPLLYGGLRIKRG
jgi:hypothetical protein